MSRRVAGRALVGAAGRVDQPLADVFSCRLYGLRRYEKQLNADRSNLSVPADTVQP